LRAGLYQAPPDIKAMVEQKPETLTYVRLLVQLKDESRRAKLIAQVLDGQMTRDQLQRLVTDPPAKPASVKSLTSVVPENDGDIYHNQVEEIVNNVASVVPENASEIRNNSVRGVMAEPPAPLARSVAAPYGRLAAEVVTATAGGGGDASAAPDGLPQPGRFEDALEALKEVISNLEAMLVEEAYRPAADQKQALSLQTQRLSRLLEGGQATG
jgi:hypothetical protein